MQTMNARFATFTGFSGRVGFQQTSRPILLQRAGAIRKRYTVI